MELLIFVFLYLPPKVKKYLYVLIFAYYFINELLQVLYKYQTPEAFDSRKNFTNAIKNLASRVAKPRVMTGF